MINRRYSGSEGIWFARADGEPRQFLIMKHQNKPSPQEELYERIDKLVDLKERLEQEIQAILANSTVAPSGCWIARYLAKGRKGFYWYYKL